MSKIKFSRFINLFVSLIMIVSSFGLQPVHAEEPESVSQNVIVESGTFHDLSYYLAEISNNEYRLMLGSFDSGQEMSEINGDTFPWSKYGEKIKKIEVVNFVSLPSDVSGMFAGLGIGSFDFYNLDASRVIIADNFLANCPNLTSIDFVGANFSSLKSAINFLGDTTLQSSVIQPCKVDEDWVQLVLSNGYNPLQDLELLGGSGSHTYNSTQYNCPQSMTTETSEHWRWQEMDGCDCTWYNNTPPSVCNPEFPYCYRCFCSTPVYSNYGGWRTERYGSYTGACQVESRSTTVTGTIPDQTYTGSALTPNPTVTNGTKTLVNGTDYRTSYVNNINAGNATCTVTGITFTGSFNIPFTIKKANNPIKFNPAYSKVSWSTSSQDKAFTAATNAQGSVTYTLTAQKNGSTNVNYFSIPSAGANTLRVAANAPQGNYTITIKASAAGNSNYNSGSVEKTFDFDIVKKPNPMKVLDNQSGSVVFSTSAQDKAFNPVTDAVGAVEYMVFSQENASGDLVQIATIANPSSPTLTIAASAPVGTYKLVIQATANGDDDYAYDAKDFNYTLTITKADNPITWPETQTVETVFSEEAKPVSFVAPTLAEGDVTYRIVSQKNSSNATINKFSLESPSVAKLVAAANTAPGSYKVVVESTAAGNRDYNPGSKQQEITVIISKGENNMSFDQIQNLTTSYSAQPVILDANEATGVGTITYTIISAQDDVGEDVNYFTLNSNSAADIKVAGATPAGLFTILVQADSTGDANYDAGQAISRILLSITKAENPVTPPQGGEQDPIKYSDEEQEFPIPEPELPEDYTGTPRYQIVKQVRVPGNAPVEYFSIEDPVSPNLTVSGGTPAGDYVVTIGVNLPATAEYEAKYLEYDVEIHIDKSENNGTTQNPQEIDVTRDPDGPSKGEFTPTDGADGPVKYYIADDNPQNIKDSFTIPDETKPELAIDPDTKPGEYTIKVRVVMEGDENHEPKEEFIELNVNLKKSENPAEFVVEQSGSTKYSDDSQTLPFADVESAVGDVTYRVVSSDPNVAFTIGEDGSNLEIPGGTSVGEYTITIEATVAGDDYFDSVTEQITYTLTINKSDEPIAIDTDQEIEVPNDPENPTSGDFDGPVNPHGDITYEIISQVDEDGDTTDCFSIEDPKSPTITKKAGCPTGTYTVEVKVTDPGDENHEPSETIITLTIIVDRAPSRLTAPGPQGLGTAYSDEPQFVDLEEEAQNAIGSVNYMVKSISKDGNPVSGISTKNLSLPSLLLEGKLPVGTYDLVVTAHDEGDSQTMPGEVDMVVLLAVAKASDKIIVPEIETEPSVEYDEDPQPVPVDPIESDRPLVCTIVATHEDGTVVDGFEMDCKTGIITIPGGAKPGVYDLEITVKDPGDENHEPTEEVYHQTLVIDPAENDMDVNANQTIEAPYSPKDQEAGFTKPSKVKGNLTCSITVKDASGNTVSGFSVNCETGKITIPGKTIGEYSAVIRVTDDGGVYYKPVTKEINAKLIIGKGLTDEQKCKLDGGFWYNGKCNEKDLSEEEKCKLAGKFWYNNKCNDKDMTDEEKCKLAGKFWYNNKCNDKDQTAEEKCRALGKYWYNNKCNDTPQSEEEKCRLAGKYWYNNKCNDTPQNLPVKTNAGDAVSFYYTLTNISLVGLISAIIAKKKREDE